MEILPSSSIGATSASTMSVLGQKLPSGERPPRKAAIRRDQHVAEGPTPDMQRRIVDRVEPKTLFPFGAPGEGPRARGTIRWASPVIDTGSRFWFSPHSVG